ncbi:hypothetical protein BV898_04250 [Hypsibius exemplaris]|uniref:Uncharacterized protein n=1 Tax=Hypsibius exemplaris TaxID=2072580 RepID=A0A1W0X2J5_HYPEX|nr:hypothetical protein BV898_04250 [Hypsibius exemplaris]
MSSSRRAFEERVQIRCTSVERRAPRRNCRKKIVEIRPKESNVCRGYCSPAKVPVEVLCVSAEPSFDYSFQDNAIEQLKCKLEDIEPRPCGVGEKLARVTDDMTEFRELLTARRREIEDLEVAIYERLGKTEEQLTYQVREFTGNRSTISADERTDRSTVSADGRTDRSTVFADGRIDGSTVSADGRTDRLRVSADGRTDHSIVSADGRTDCSTVSADEWTDRSKVSANGVAIRQALNSIVSEVGCLKKDVMENLCQINKRMECHDEAIDTFCEEITLQIQKFGEQICARRTDVKELRYQVDAKFSAVKAALRRPPRVSSQPSMQDSPEPGEHLLDTVTMIVRSGNEEEPEESLKARKYRPRRKRSDSTPRSVEVVQTDPPVARKKPCKYPRNRNPVMVAAPDATTREDEPRNEIFQEADKLLDKIRKDSKHDMWP